MTTPTFKPRLPFLALMLCGTFAAAPAWAVPTTDPAELAELAARHQAERTACMKLQDLEARTDCVRDTTVAYGHAKRNRASDIDPPFAKNLTLRCDAMTGGERTECLARMGGQGTTAGSVAEGAIYRELVIFEIGPVPAPAPATMAPSGSTAPGAAPAAPMLLIPSAPTVSTPPSATAPSATNPTTPK